MTAFSPALPRTIAHAPQARPRPTDLSQDEGSAALAALALAVPAAILATALWFVFHGASVLQLAGVYALTANLTFWLTLTGLGAVRRRPRGQRAHR
jgi:hypothetical protein